jgi:signal transduction histidine kinase
MGPQLQSAGVRLRRLGLDRPCPLVGDGEQLLVAISNLLRNVLESLSAGGPGARQGWIEVGLGRLPEELVLAVGDNGPGMSAAVLEFWPLITTQPDGTGIGLYLVQAAVENHGGRLAFDRSPCGGAEGRLPLPLAPEPFPGATFQPAPTSQASRGGPPRRARAARSDEASLTKPIGWAGLRLRGARQTRR